MNLAEMSSIRMPLLKQGDFPRGNLASAHHVTAYAVLSGINESGEE